ncbi:hypothetical protein HZB78_03660 [Candidatus Collierbacteria bacterium]|nr:hypothetical protein [Candidatus Collierbacteria bacterium]
MKRFSAEQRKLIADYFSQIGAAWFVAGVIGIFFGNIKTVAQTMFSFLWGIGWSLVFLGTGTFILKGAR